MIISTLVEQAVGPLLHFVRETSNPLPSSTAPPNDNVINTDGIVTFITTKIAPILIAAIGVLFISRAHKGEMSKVLTSSAIVIIGIAFIVGAGFLFLFGQGLVRLVFGES